MPPSREALRRAILRHLACWNARDREGWIATRGRCAPSAGVHGYFHAPEDVERLGDARSA